MKQLLKIQLYVNQNPISNEEIVSEKYHIFLDDFSFCKKVYQDTKFFETDLCLKYQNLMKLPIDKLKILVKENKHLICSNYLPSLINGLKSMKIVITIEF